MYKISLSIRRLNKYYTYNLLEIGGKFEFEVKFFTQFGYFFLKNYMWF